MPRPEGKPSTQGKPPPYNYGQAGYRSYMITLPDKQGMRLEELAQAAQVKPSDIIQQMFEVLYPEDAEDA